MGGPESCLRAGEAAGNSRDMSFFATLYATGDCILQSDAVHSPVSEERPNFPRRPAPRAAPG